jgi:5-carboxymethyl-2-hydroxymuconate isomerase
MRFGTLRDGTPVAVMDGRGVPLRDLGFDGSLLELIQAGEGAHDSVRAALGTVGAGRPIAAADLAAPVTRPSKIVAIGLNYRDHAREQHLDLPEQPLVFAKFPTSIIGPTDPIEVSAKLTNKPDYEAELAIVVGRTARSVPESDALSYVFGYTILNDATARDLQQSDKQWVRSKSLDTFCPLGPVIVTRDEIPDPQSLRIGCSVNGETRQDGTTHDMVFGVAQLVARLSEWFTLEPGDLIATGTPAGVGDGRRPPVYLRDGDVVRTWIEGIGELVNRVEFV